ncbi:DNA-binding transcriptional regulator LsrR, DeoR family [Asanoa hainanensis]|uniref:DNA-binding transcriptional regulator LsrR, DeoR family n=1 Tax=Asanoa hainanensis TaxID=560556 RepID=A0A239NIY0_9ACTN|nr:sugar-binding transcriptional regulator [Asanoa hainanensis]SNT54278.1 DNA-binding transcriptional regulator LsrR, DeoR family [Asanoa hainanensis]
MSPKFDANAGVEPYGVADEHTRLLTKVARMYHERGLRQPQIAEQLHISQPRVSRLLKQAVALGIVRTVVITPRGVHAELEEAVEQRYGLTEVVIADTDGQTEESAVTQAIASAAAVYLETTLIRNDRVGISSWSGTLLATVDAMHPTPSLSAERVVQILGGVGTSAAQSAATRLTGGLARNTRAEAVYLVAPGLVATPAMRDALVHEPSIASVIEAWQDLTVALVGVGSLAPSKLLRQSGNAIAAEEEQRLREVGAIGDVCMRFFDEHGQHVASPLDDRVLGISAETLKKVPRRVGVAGGERKWRAIRAALSGGWLNVLITDHATALDLVAD